ncbi:DUF4349 domain-containing protein [Flavobacterium sp. WLB]|uniref:DUF4349 domain-containing protein n=1 Tax=unclassified Flavobacterium TaxID=196869 RepID=UPI0006ABB9DA|nr:MULTISPECIES: DUF4349 domain-containing protein [unclassified Flavobacterium]KOP39171.1 hypothetical protein AKO67_06380 [Flavobacterium sp. VMW]OWU89169.1 hypothetical protein APR43_18375 [Flavobacterium sp. NLM]PUU67765.1 DUF4349 domain-containing protein [Flavobacterium sp. WLB]
MKTTAKLGLTALTIITLLFSCKKADYDSGELADAKMAADTTAISSSAAVEHKDSKQKFIRTADIKFKVKNVVKSTYAIKNAVQKFGGFVTYTNLQSNIHDQIKTKISQDSTLETTKYSVENNITIRVPNTKLDTIIKTIAKQIDFLDYRIIKADDVSIKLLANQLSQKRGVVNEKRVEKAIDSKGKKINDIIDAENTLANQKEENDDRIIENLSMQDQINFSTITLQLYQNETIKQEIMAGEKDSAAYKPNLGIQIFDALKSGWYILQAILVFFVNLWPIILLIISGFFLYKKYYKK